MIKVMVVDDSAYNRVTISRMLESSRVIRVVATAVNAVPDVVVPGETGLLVPPHRPDLMASAVRYLLDSPATAARMSVIVPVLAFHS